MTSAGFEFAMQVYDQNALINSTQSVKIGNFLYVVKAQICGKYNCLQSAAGEFALLVRYPLPPLMHLLKIIKILKKLLRLNMVPQALSSF